MDDLHLKFENLKKYISSLGKVGIAFSGGVDSTFLLKVAHDVLGDNVVAFNVNSPLIAENEKMAAEGFCSAQNIRLQKIKVDILSFEKVKENSCERCYFCKKEIFSEIIKKADSLGIKNICDGTNADDTNDFRPGIKALRELNILSPLKYNNFSKNEIRLLSKELNLPTFNLPSAACLASRIPYGDELTLEKLKLVEKSENYLNELGFIKKRVRIHKNLARIEIDKNDFDKFLIQKEKIVEKLKSFGFVYVTLDLQGFRSGSMNEVLK